MKIHIAGLFLLGFLAVPSMVDAFGFEGQTATRLTDDLVLYTVEYQLGYEKFAMETPVAAIRSERNTEQDRVTYQFLDNSDEPTDIGVAHAIVLSSASTEGEMYQVEQGSRESFTLVTILKLPEVIDENLDVALQITTLPFLLSAEEKTVENGLNVSELQYFITDEVDVDIR